MAKVVADASVLIALGQIGQLSPLEKLFGQIVIPSAVAREVAPGLPQLPGWIQTRGLERPLDGRVAAASLDAGEVEAIGLAMETKAAHLILDDLPARRQWPPKSPFRQGNAVKRFSSETAFRC